MLESSCGPYYSGPVKGIARTDVSSGNTNKDDLGPQHQVTIRELEIDDLAAVYRLGESLFTRRELPALYRTWDPYEVTHYYNTDPDFCVVAETNGGELVGFALGSTVDKDGASWRYGYLAWLGVKPGYQGRRVAQRLLREFEKRMKEEGVRMLLVDTEGDNAKALAFFNKEGFSRPTTHVWLTKSLSRRDSSALKPLKPLGPAGAKGADGSRRNGNGRKPLPGAAVAPGLEAPSPSAN